MYLTRYSRVDLIHCSNANTCDYMAAVDRLNALVSVAINVLQPPLAYGA